METELRKTLSVLFFTDSSVWILLGNVFFLTFIILKSMYLLS